MFYLNRAESLSVVLKREIISGQKLAQNLSLRFSSTTEENGESNHIIYLDSNVALVLGKQK